MPEEFQKYLNFLLNFQGTPHTLPPEKELKQLVLSSFTRFSPAAITTAIVQFKNYGTESGVGQQGAATSVRELLNDLVQDSSMLRYRCAEISNKEGRHMEGDESDQIKEKGGNDVRGGTRTFTALVSNFFFCCLL